MHSRPTPLAAIPDAPVPVPPRVADLTAGRELTSVWINGLGGVTFRDPGPAGTEARFVKWTAAGTPEIDLAQEAHRLAWAAAHGAAVPRVLDHGSDAAGSWLVTAALNGESAVSPRWIAEPETAARAIGVGLRVLHEQLPVSEAPAAWSIERRIAQFEDRVRAGDGPAHWSAEYRQLSVAEARARLADAPPLDGPVVCHGDACAPNTLLDGAGRFLAHVDLQELGVADRWADLAVAAWSTEWNYGAGFDHLVYEGYEIAPDPERIAYYRLLWDLS
ncbi:Aminoglycoside phosphotransferase [Leucobacter sp. 7(1)]|uniref:aminoglycoside 3'-phosphotransferase n=1 Tax=Leucobacter sp. 7(1) TaxID=1255613 RepID=UPI00097EA165|nr:aminoglycoside 3'-phosphotransferase [Leucobacter sp. 7(1)]SJN08350.1 Aminoglycoside phosphotransferase [Leucobacter sp. 7(1)]